MKLEIMFNPEDGDGYWVNVCELDGPAIWGDGPFETESAAKTAGDEYLRGLPYLQHSLGFINRNS